jgi:hypothetical protein
MMLTPLDLADRVSAIARDKHIVQRGITRDYRLFGSGHHLEVLWLPAMFGAIDVVCGNELSRVRGGWLV